VLLLIGRVHDLAFEDMQLTMAAAGETIPVARRAITFVGAGVYEEVLFRLGLLPVAYAVFRLMRLGRIQASVLAVLLSSVFFAGAHYIGPTADELTLFSFTFRAMAGMFFAGLFVVRGFGITVGCHAMYDLLVGVILLVPDVA